MDDVRQLPISSASDVNALVYYLPQASRIARDTAQQIRAVPAPQEDQQAVDRMTGLWDQQADALDGAVAALQGGDSAALQQSLQQGETAAAEADQIANSLGATACAQTPVPGLVP
jgi:hypothetical protein